MSQPLDRKKTYHRNLIIRTRTVIIPPPPIHRPPRDSFKVVQAQDLVQVRLDVLFWLGRTGRVGGGAGDGDGSWRGRGGGGGRCGEGGRDEGA